MLSARLAANPACRRARWWLAALAGVVIAGCGGGSSTSDDPPPAATPQERGAQLYAAGGANCIQCHVDPTTMRRGTADEPALAALIGGAIRDNKGRMGDPVFGLSSLGDDDLAALASFIFSVAPEPPPTEPPAVDPPPGGPAVQCVPAQPTSTVRTVQITGGLASPWGMAFLPDGRVLVTQKGGTMVIVSADGATRTPVAWDTPQPSILDLGQGGLLDVALDPDFTATGWVYFTYQEPGDPGTFESGTTVGRARLDGMRLKDFQRLYQQRPKMRAGGGHFGSRIAFRADKTMFVTLGERMWDDPSNPTLQYAQNPASGLGKVVRIARDGSIPADNPEIENGVPGLWSLGHRNPQGAAVDPNSGALWLTEHGPQGGDELNLVVAGGNFGWPLRSYGCPYGSPVGDACRVGGGVHAPIDGLSFVEPVTFWAPTSVAPSNLVIYSGSGFPEWRGQMFIGSLAGRRLWRVVVDGSRFVSCEPLLGELNQRIRDVRQGPDGWLYIATDEGQIHRVQR